MRRLRQHYNRGFTLFEVVMAMLILGLLGGAVYALSTAALETSKVVKWEYQACNRLDAFLRVLSQSFVNLPADAVVYLKMKESVSGAPIPEIIFERAPGVFGISSMGAGELALAAKPLSNGTREFALLLRQERGTPFPSRIETSKEPCISLLGGVENVVWRFKRGEEDWLEEWQSGAGRPRMVRVTFDYAGAPHSPVDAQFWVPEVDPPAQISNGKENPGKDQEPPPKNEDVPSDKSQ